MLIDTELNYKAIIKYYIWCPVTLEGETKLDEHVGQQQLVDESDLSRTTITRKYIISETPRLYPPAPLLVPRFSSRTALWVGTTSPVTLCYWSIMHGAIHNIKNRRGSHIFWLLLVQIPCKKSNKANRKTMANRVHVLKHVQW